MTPTETLRHEHDVILKVLGAAEREAESITASGAIDGDRVARIVDFVRSFADGCHHAKEEGLLFVRLGERGFPAEFGPVAIMLAEHEEGRQYISIVAEALPAASGGDATARQRVRDGLLCYAQLLRAHIEKENTILFPMADQALTAADQAELTEAFARVERDEVGEGVHETYHRLAEELAAS